MESPASLSFSGDRGTLHVELAGNTLKPKVHGSRLVIRAANLRSRSVGQVAWVSPRKDDSLPAMRASRLIHQGL